MRQSAIKITAIVGALILLGTAGFHMTAMPQLRASIAPIDSGFYQKGIPAMWVIPAAHWIFIAFLSIGLSHYKSKACAAILMAFGFWVLIDALIIFTYAGPFIGIYMLALAGGLLLTAGLKLRSAMKDS